MRVVLVSKKPERSNRVTAVRFGIELRMRSRAAHVGGASDRWLAPDVLGARLAASASLIKKSTKVCDRSALTTSKIGNGMV